MLVCWFVGWKKADYGNHQSNHPTMQLTTYPTIFKEALMPQAVWNGEVLAENDSAKKLAGSHYFPPDSLTQAHFRKSYA